MVDFRHIVIEAYADVELAAREGTRLIGALGGDVYAELAVHGPALAQLHADSAVADAVQASPLRVVIESDAVTSNTADDAGFRHVASVPAYLVEAQWSGWAYLRY